MFHNEVKPGENAVVALLSKVDSFGDSVEENQNLGMSQFSDSILNKVVILEIKLCSIIIVNFTSLSKQ